MSRPEESARGLQTDVGLCGGMYVLEPFYVVALGISMTCQVSYALWNSTGVSTIDVSG